jgi:hypothetical protein
MSSVYKLNKEEAKKITSILNRAKKPLSASEQPLDKALKNVYI